MSNPVEKLLDAEADKQALIDEITEDREESFRNRYQELLWNVDERDTELWAIFVEDATITLADFEAVDVINRDHEWIAGMSAMLAATKQQAWLEVFGVDLLEIAENEGRKIDRQVNKLSKDQLKIAAVKGVGKKRFADARDRRQAFR